MKFMFRELFPRMDIQLSPEIAVQLYCFIISRNILSNQEKLPFLMEQITFLSSLLAQGKYYRERVKYARPLSHTNPYIRVNIGCKVLHDTPITI